MKSFDKDILKLAVPSILANITVPLVGMVDIAIAGHLTDLKAASMIGGISIGSMLFDLMYWNFSFLRSGTGGLTAQAYGRKDRKDCADILSRGVGLAFFISFFLIAIQVIFLKVALTFIPCSDAVSSLATQYFKIRIYAAPATLSLMAFKGWFIGMQDSVSAMITDLTVNGVNVFASFVIAYGVPFMGVQGIGFQGIALGTVIAQYTGLLMAILLLYVKYGKRVFEGYKIKDALNALKTKGAGKFLNTNIDLFIRSLCLIVVYIGFTSIASGYGDLLLAVSTIMMKLLLLFSYFTDGFAYAGEAKAGKYIGMKDLVNTRLTVKTVFVWSLSIGVVFILACMGGFNKIINLMTSDSEVVEECSKYFLWLLPMPIAGCAAFTWDGIYVGATASGSMRNAALWSVAAFFAIWFAGKSVLRDVSPEIYIHVLMAAYFAHLSARALYLTVRYKRDIIESSF